MAIKHCKECGTEISSSAKTCPKCGKKQIFSIFKIIILLIVIILLIPFIINFIHITALGLKVYNSAASDMTNVNSTSISTSISSNIEDSNINY